MPEKSAESKPAAVCIGRGGARGLRSCVGAGILQGMVVNLAYAALRLAMGLQQESAWSAAVGVYHASLGALRAYVFCCFLRCRGEEAVRCCRRVAVCLFLLNIPMSGMMALMVLEDEGFSYPGYLIYAFALYTFYAMAVAVVNVIRFRRADDVLLFAVRALNLAAAMMSVLGLQTAMLARFSGGAVGYCRTMNALTGIGVLAGVTLLALWLLCCAGRVGKRGKNSA